MTSLRPLAVVTGASSGIGLHLAKECAEHGYDLVVAADTPLADAVTELESFGCRVEALQTDLSKMAGVDELVRLIGDRAVDALLANAGQGMGKAFLDQDFEGVVRVIDTNVSGTLCLIHQVGRRMRAAHAGKILITGSIAGFIPGSFAAVYNATKAFIDSFSWALRNELKDSGITVSCLMPGITDTEFFARADLLDTKAGAEKNKMQPADVAKIGFKAMMDGDGDVVAGLKNRLQTAMANITPAAILAEQHRGMMEPGSAHK